MLGIDYEYQRLDRCWGRIMIIREARQMLGTDYEYQRG